MKRKPLELYVHIPFCKKKCNYCDFLSAPASKPRRQEYMQALMTEIMIWSGAAYDNHEVKSIFIGGGTPSILEGDQIKALMRMLNIYFNISSSAEITIECNPGMVNKDKLLAYREAGINRLSIGLQSACDEELAVLGRIHTWADFAATYNLARQCGFTNINVDLMSALPGQTLESWTDTLKMVAELNPEHISAYSLIIEEGTPFYARYGELVNDDVQVGGKPAVAVGYTEDVTENADGTISAENGAKLVSVTDEMAAWPDLPDEDTERAMYAATEEILAAYGYHRYEISNYAKKNKECSHNVGYWTGVDYIGLGLGASSLFENARFSNLRDIAVYKEAAEKAQLPTDWETVQHQKEENRIEEFMFLGLRMMRGVSRKEFERRFKKPMDEVYGEVIAKYKEMGLLEEADGWVRLTAKGIDVSNVVLADFLLDIEEEEVEILEGDFEREVEEELQRELEEEKKAAEEAAAEAAEKTTAETAETSDIQ